VSRTPLTAAGARSPAAFRAIRRLPSVVVSVSDTVEGPPVSRTLLLCLALAPLAHAAPAPFLKPSTPPQADVLIRGNHPDVRLRNSAPQVVASAGAYSSLASAWGIKAPPSVNFRTHVLVVSTAPQRLRPVQYELRPNGDLQTKAM